MGIPNTSVCQTSFMDAGKTVTLGLTATQRFAAPTVTDDGAGTYQAAAGAGTPTAYGQWQFDYYLNFSPGGGIGPYVLELLYDVDPAMANDASTHGVVLFPIVPGMFPLLASDTVQDSWNLGFGFLNAGVTPGVTLPAPAMTFDPTAIGEYTFSLRLLAPGGALVGSPISILVNTVPEPATYAMLGLGLAGLGWLRKRRA